MVFLTEKSFGWEGPKRWIQEPVLCDIRVLLYSKAMFKHALPTGSIVLIAALYKHRLSQASGCTDAEAFLTRASDQNVNLLLQCSNDASIK